MRTIRLKSKLAPEEADRFAGLHLTDDYYDELITDEAKVLKPNGQILLVLRKRVISPELLRRCLPIIRQAAATTDNRGLAGGIKFGGPDHGNRPGVYGKGAGARFKRIKKDGTVSNTNDAKRKVNSGLMGYFDRNARYPYCRLTKFGITNWDGYQACQPLIQKVDRVFAETVPHRYRAQKKKVRDTNPDFYIHGTAFTTITVNRNWQTAVHKDAGDLRQGFGVMSVIRAGLFEGYYLCFPEYRVAVDMQNGDVLMADVHEWHGNTTPHQIVGGYERVSMVFYYREKMAECGSAEEEAERAKKLRGDLQPA